MKKITATSLILLMISLFLQQTLSKEILGDAAERNVKQEKEQAHEVHCSRERSRAAWNIIEEYLMPFVERENYQISTKCRLHPDNDLFRNQEQHKIQVDTNDWKCGYCKKSFHAEKYLDQHFDSRHYNLLNVSEGKCLADLCGALHCDFVMNSKSPKTKCKPAAVAKNRHLCESLADTCFPPNQGRSASRLHEGNKCHLSGHVNTDLDAAASILSCCLFISERNEAGNSRAETNRSSWKEDKAIIVNWHPCIVACPPRGWQLFCKCRVLC
ncbi:uncharacterized protein LOC110617680 isoform X1 [Manihot esculenta]|uniref:uncharacterized protein LOC110617680 isoform X1 n=1 Tax=Manihot esculenta TaxID=3983 RepID=UPI001CC79310|nr:uncharacterized protein LOC110617680 isoform X1 [Manihot esculenta]